MQCSAPVRRLRPIGPALSPALTKIALGLSLGLSSASERATAQDAITRVSVDSNGVEGDGNVSDYYTDSPISISSDGRYVGFASYATNLVANDTNGCQDVFVHDRITGATVRVSVSSSGAEGDGDSDWVSLSADGRFVAFESVASDFVANDLNGTSDVFVHDRDPDGNGIFDEGNGVTIFVSMRSNGTVPVKPSYQPSISADGRLVAFASKSPNLVTGDLNGAPDVFLRDLVAATTILVSVSSVGTQGDLDSQRPSISADDNFVAFESRATNLVSSDTNGHWDVFVHSQVNGVTARVSVASSGVQGDGDSFMASISADGGVVAFSSVADNFAASDTNYWTDVFVHDQATGVTELVSVDSHGVQGNSSNDSQTMSGDGQVLAFVGWSDNLVPGDTNNAYDVFVHERATGRTYLASALCATPADNVSLAPSISGDGGLIAFASYADNLVTGDTNGHGDAFVFDRSVDTATWSNYGAGFAGTLGIPGLSASEDPVLGTTTAIDVASSYGLWTVGFLFIGLNRSSLPTNVGGTLLVDFIDIVPLAVSPYGDALKTDIPFDPALAALLADFQLVEVDPGAQFGFAFSPGLEFRLGR
jgi:cold shock CspA family protein